MIPGWLIYLAIGTVISFTWRIYYHWDSPWEKTFSPKRIIAAILLWPVIVIFALIGWLLIPF